MPARNIVVGQTVTPTKLERAKELRQQMTPAERTLWDLVRARRLGGLHFRRQQVIDGFIVDFYCHAAALVIELDGSAHQLQGEYDGERDEHMRRRGLRVLRFTNDEVRDTLDGVLERIVVVSRGATPPPPAATPPRREEG